MQIRSLLFPLVLATGGCTTMLSHVVYSEEDIRRSAKQIALMEKCVDQGIVWSRDAEGLKSAFAQLLTVADYSKQAYADSYATTKQLLVTENSERLRPACIQLSESVKPITQELIGKYAQISGQRQRDLAGMASQASSIQVPNFGVYNAMPRPVQPNFAPQRSGTSHYLIDAGQGQRLCSVSASGIARCN